MHPQHILIQETKSHVRDCAICERYIMGLGYYCRSSGCDQFQMHIGCAQDKGGVMNDDNDEEQRRIVIHRSHPEHELRLLRMCSLRCDACGTKKLGYVVHIKCAFKKSHPATTTTTNNENGKDIIRFPVNDVGGEQIRAFVMKMKLGEIMPPIPHGDDHVKYYTFHHHKHQLTLISSSNIDGEEEEEEDSSDEEDNDYTYKSKLICDGCITPITFKRERSNQYLSCSSCKYYLHWECFHLPPHLPSLTPLHEPDHQLVLQSAPKLDFGMDFFCSVCRCETNGLFYACTRCEFKADINCASVPNTIYHSAHPHHPLNLLNKNDLLSKGYDSWRLWWCAAGCRFFGGSACYVCESCDEFTLHVKCALLPPSVRNRRWDKHLLPLMYDAYVNHPDEFYCDHCEIQINPKTWMYHCRPCDLSFHPFCFSAASGWYSNIKFGQQYHMNSAHPHPLTYQLLTTKRRSDVCREDAYTYPGFHCASCNFFICLYNCIYRKMLEDGDIHAVD
ncbi:hypothetical protein C2S52_021003 [Perilla frutescens var. hirtella]|nr:hypothetical protein C2S52_021003 [Perilla frutescens var. hirtella]